MPRIKNGFKGERTIVLPAFLIEKLKQDPLGQELYITDIGYYPHANFHYCERTAEEVNEFVLIYCVEGQGWFELAHRRNEINSNQFFILPKHVAHAYGSIPPIPGPSTGYTSTGKRRHSSVADSTVHVT